MDANKEVPSPVPEVGPIPGETWGTKHSNQIVETFVSYDGPCMSEMCRRGHRRLLTAAGQSYCPQIVAECWSKRTPSPSPMGKVERSLVGSRWTTDGPHAQAFTVDADPWSENATKVHMIWDRGSTGVWDRDKMEADFTRIDAPEAPKAGRFPPQAGDVWRWNDHESTGNREGQEVTFTGACNKHGQWVTREGTSAFMEGQFTDGRISFVRHAPEVSGEVVARKGGCLASFCAGADDPRVYRCRSMAGHHGRHACGAKLEAYDTPAPTPTPLPVERRRATYESLLAEMEASEGVVRPPVARCVWQHPRCSSPASTDLHCAKHAVEWDAQHAAMMIEEGHTKPVAEPPPWTPSTDPDFWIPGVNEHGGT